MRIVLGLPVVDHPDLTHACIQSIERTVSDPTTFELVLVDNNSSPAYAPLASQLPHSLLRNDENRGFYYPLLQLYERHPEADLIGLCHNDLLFYEQGWDVRMKGAFTRDPQLGLVGLCGSWQADAGGGRGGGTMCHFRGERGQPQSAGERITDLRPAVLLDSLFLLFRRDVIPHLGIDDDIALCHFYDKIWSLRTIEAGYRVAVLGVEVDHLGGQTSTLGAYNQTARQWCLKRGIPVGENGDLGMYQEAERRYLAEYHDQKQMISCHVTSNYDIITHHHP